MNIEKNCAGGKSKYQLKNPNKNHRTLKASVDVKQIARYRIDKSVLESDAIKVMNQGINSNGKDRNAKLMLDLSQVNPIAAVKRVESESGQPRWVECEGKFDPSLCGPREPSAYLKKAMRSHQERHGCKCPTANHEIKSISKAASKQVTQEHKNNRWGYLYRG